MCNFAIDSGKPDGPRREGDTEGVEDIQLRDLPQQRRTGVRSAVACPDIVGVDDQHREQCVRELHPFVVRGLESPHSGHGDPSPRQTTAGYKLRRGPIHGGGVKVQTSWCAVDDVHPSTSGGWRLKHEVNRVHVISANVTDQTCPRRRGTFEAGKPERRHRVNGAAAA